mmetsp:Transcript_22878/g.58088  ORF Transcript_22878/g.58088 Transcript_22878/m.58088 type:complete len:332 (-) Transcript_22878:1707-2702(-)
MPRRRPCSFRWTKPAERRSCSPTPPNSSPPTGRSWTGGGSATGCAQQSCPCNIPTRCSGEGVGPRSGTWTTTECGESDQCAYSCPTCSKSNWLRCPLPPRHRPPSGCFSAKRNPPTPGLSSANRPPSTVLLPVPSGEPTSPPPALLPVCSLPGTGLRLSGETKGALKGTLPSFLEKSQEWQAQLNHIDVTTEAPEVSSSTGGVMSGCANRKRRQSSMFEFVPWQLGSLTKSSVDIRVRSWASRRTTAIVESFGMWVKFGAELLLAFGLGFGVAGRAGLALALEVGVEFETELELALRLALGCWVAFRPRESAVVASSWVHCCPRPCLAVAI